MPDRRDVPGFSGDAKIRHFSQAPSPPNRIVVLLCHERRHPRAIIAMAGKRVPAEEEHVKNQNGEAKHILLFVTSVNTQNRPWMIT
jgi:hypothetical protein